MRDLRAAYAGKTVLVTGDTGFKGSWLTLWLRELNANVIGFALPPRSQRDNFVTCGLADRIIHSDGDVRNYDQVASVIQKHRPEIVFHLAAQAIVLDSYSDPRGTFDTNVMGVVNLLEAVRHSPSVRSVVVVTSDKCYENVGDQRGFRETDPFGGRDPYSGSKGAAEVAIASFRRSFFEAAGTAAIASARAGNVIGAGDWSPFRIVPDCVRALIAHEPIVVRNPESVRPWQHVLDALHGYLQLGAHLQVAKEQFSGGWNFGPTLHERVPVKELVAQVISAWGEGTLTIDATAPHVVESAFLHLDSEKATSQLAWAPRLNFRRTIEMTIDGYRVEARDPGASYAHRIDQIRSFQQAA